MFSATNIKKLFSNWYRNDSVFKNYKNAGIVISNFNIEKRPSSEFLIFCFVDFYSVGEMSRGAVIPLEGHGIVDNKFLKQREIAFFKIIKDTHIFSNWANL